MISPSKVAPTRSSKLCTYRKFDQKEKLRCRFCRGNNCTRCGKDAYTKCVAPAISNFHSNWILDSVLAMQRPSDELFDSIMLIEAFQVNGITAVINLCEPGEHPYCGYPVKNSGFPYTPERLMTAGIKCFNFYWRDMTVPSLTLAQNTIRVALTEILKGGKVAVHCHAGFGRTGIVVACLALILKQLTAEDAIALVRSKRPGSVQTPGQQAFVHTFHAAYHQQICVFPLADQPHHHRKAVADSMNDELLSPPLHVVTSSADHTLLTKEHLPNAVRLSTLILKHLTPFVGKIGLCLALGRLPQVNVSVDRGTSQKTTQSTSPLISEEGRKYNNSIQSFLRDNKVKPNSTGNILCEAPISHLDAYKSYANSGQWKKWFALPNSMSKVPVERVVGQLNDDDYDEQHIDVQKLLLHFASPPSSSVRRKASDTGIFPSPAAFPTITVDNDDADADADDKEQLVSDCPVDSHLITFMACHGSLLLDWFDTRADAMFSSGLLETLRTLRIGDYGPYYYSRRSDIPLSELFRAANPPTSGNALDTTSHKVQWDEDGYFASVLDVALRRHLSKRKLQLLEAVVAVLSPLFDDAFCAQMSIGLRHQDSMTNMYDSEISIFLVCAEMRVALSMCQHFKDLSTLIIQDNNGIDRESIEDLFGKNFLSYDTNPKSRGTSKPMMRESTMSSSESGANRTSLPDSIDPESLDDVVNVMNTLRFLCVNKWSALGDSFLACSVVGSPSQMQKSMLNTRQQHVHWNEEWID